MSKTRVAPARPTTKALTLADVTITWKDDTGLARRSTFNDRYWSTSREPQRSMASRGYDPRQSPGLGYKRLCLVKTLSTALTCWPYRNTALRDGARTSTRTAGPRRRGKPKHSHRGHPVPGPGNVAAKRCASEKRAF